MERETLLEKQQKTLENEIKSHAANNQKLNTLIIKIEKDRDKLGEEVQQVHEKMEKLNEELAYKTRVLLETKEKLSAAQSKMTQINTMYENARTERNNLERELQACTEDRDTLRERIKILVKQEEQSKEDIAAKQTDLTKAHRNIDRIEKEKTSLKTEIQNIVISLQHTKSELNEKTCENNRLYKTLTVRIKLNKATKNSIREV